MSNLALQQTTPTQSQALSAFSSESAFVSVQRMAKALASSTLVPDAYRGEANLGNCIIALELSQRIGASVMAVMQSMVPIHGKPTWSAAFLIATVNSCGRFSPMRFRWVGKENTDEWGCRAYAVEREGNLELVGALVTIAMAKAEGWYTKNGSKWKTMPEQMLQYRAAAFWTRAYAPEIALGMHTAEEIHDTPEANQVVKPVVMDVTPTPPEPKPRRTKKEPEAVVVQEPAPVQVDQVDSEPEPAPTAPEPVPAPEPLQAHVPLQAKEQLNGVQKQASNIARVTFREPVAYEPRGPVITYIPNPRVQNWLPPNWQYQMAPYPNNLRKNIPMSRPLVMPRPYL